MYVRLLANSVPCWNIDLRWVLILPVVFHHLALFGGCWQSHDESDNLVRNSHLTKTWPYLPFLAAAFKFRHFLTIGMWRWGGCFQGQKLSLWWHHSMNGILWLSYSIRSRPPRLWMNHPIRICIPPSLDVEPWMPEIYEVKRTLRSESSSPSLLLCPIYYPWTEVCSTCPIKTPFVWTDRERQRKKEWESKRAKLLSEWPTDSWSQELSNWPLRQLYDLLITFQAPLSELKFRGGCQPIESLMFHWKLEKL